MAKLNYLKGTFGKKIIYCKFMRCKNSDNYFIFLHGSYGSSFKDKYTFIAKKIVKSGLGNVFLYETSRNIYTFEDNEIVNDFEKYRKTFEGKTFEDELSDVKTAVKYVVDTLAVKKEAKIHLIGSSLGGTLSSYLIKPYKKYIKTIILLGSGITTKGKNQPILKTYPPKEKILENFRSFSGNLILFQGTNDTVVPSNEARRIITDSKNAKTRKLIVLKGVDHTFKFINGKNKEKALLEYIFNIIYSSQSAVL